MLLIFPPLAKACEPPAGITRIAGFLRGNNQECDIWDANLEGQRYLLELEQSPVDTWSRRAWKNVQNNLEILRSDFLYANTDRYQRAVRDLNRAINKSSSSPGINISLADYQDAQFSTHQSQDLILAAEKYQENIFCSFFRERLKELLDQSKHQFVGISLNYLSQAIPAFVLAGLLKKEYPQVTIIVGGGLVTSWMRSPTWIDPFTELFDHMVAGQGEIPLLELFATPSHPKHQAPDFLGLPLELYLSPGLILPYSASTGCYWNRCSFCPEKSRRQSICETCNRTGCGRSQFFGEHI